MLGPGMVTLLGFIFLSESLTQLQVAGLLLLLIGSYIIETKKGEGFFDFLKTIKNSQYIHYLFIALMLYSVSSLADRVVLSRYHIEPRAYIAFVHLFLALNYTLYMFIKRNGIEGIFHGFKIAGWLILPIGILTISYRFALAEAVSIASVGLVSAVKHSSGFFTTIFGGELFHEDHLVRKSIAALVIVGGMALIIL